ncbi:hypothetical protein C8Q70DRAFT_370135 [Cubamyces menziesii]|nr:hypothetical protein C8Q70DRAFT_370135 [Cubamyces menziesii]
MHTSPDASFANQLRSPPVLTIPQSTPTLPPRPEFIPFTVPLLRASEPYDRKDFWTFPNRHGWLVHLGEEQCEPLCPPSRSTYRRAPLNAKGPTSKLSRADGSPVTSTSKAAFLQNWLFFGVLHEVSRMCRLSIDVEAEFINDFGRTSLSTAALNGLASRWFRSLDNKEVGETVFMAEILSVGRLTASLISEEVTQSGEPVFEYTPDEVRVFLSIDVLARTIGLHLLMHVYSPGFSFPEHEGWDRRRISESIDWFDRCVEGMNAKFADHLRDELIRQGWCINEVSLIPRDCLFFTTLLDRPRAKDHSGCGMVACGAYQTDEATYKTVHTHDLCDGSCEFVRVPTADLVGLLSQGKVPAVIIADVGSIQVVDSSDYPYIALSHVWADGLGNPNDNALPSCQLRRLRGYTKQLSEAHPWQDMPGGHKSVVAFWMDTLCIPVDPRMKQYRTKAIQLLEKTFHDAAAVLVLDRELEIVNSTTTPFLELGIRILCSGWAKRLWTLQESTLAGGAQSEDKIYFQMYDGPFLHQKLNQNRRRAVLDEFGRPEHLLEEHAMLFQSNLIWSLGDLSPRYMRYAAWAT